MTNRQYRFSPRMLLAISLVLLVGCAEATQPPTEAPQTARLLTILSVEGIVQVRATPDAEPVAAHPDQTLAVGAEVITGADGEAVIEMDDGTVIVISSESSFVVQALEGTPESPISQFFLGLGEIFAFHEGELSDDASFEIETPNGVAAIRGSMIQLTFNPVTGRVEATCMEGHCSLTAAGVTVDLTGGQFVVIEGFDLPPGEVFVMDDSQLQAWIDAANAATGGGVTIRLPEVTLPPPEATEEPGEPECGCVGPDLVCDDGTVTEDDEDCLATCACEGPNLVCDDGTVLEEDEGCLANCGCEGPDFVCGGDIVTEGDEECLSTCACEGYALVCEDGTVVEGHAECGGCLCEGYDLVCNGALSETNSAACGWVCELSRTCGDGTCQAECENSDLCPDDCSCADNGICEPGEGFGCRDCVGPDEGSGSACGTPCQGSCDGGLTCEGGFCWDACACAGNCGEPDCPVVCECIEYGVLRCVDCNGHTTYDYNAEECSEQVISPMRQILK
jgi:hypothetical protein